VLGAVGIVAEDKAILTEDQRILLDTILAQVALAIEREQSNERQRQSQIQMDRERFRSDLLRSISHDLRTPLTGILGSTNTMMENLSTLPKETVLTLLQNIYEDADWLKQLVENVLSMTRLNEGNVALKRDMEAVEELIAAALARVKMRLQHHNVIVSMPDEILMVYVDGMLIEQAIVNILDNAIKYTPHGATIAITVSADKGFILLEISNDGPGIPEKDMGHIFERFYTHADEPRRSGIGLGLSICKSIIEAHGGKIAAQNIITGGIKFIFSLPMKETEDGTADPDRG
jgi:two-component system sensor histidine kinase KdpD